MQNRYKEPDDTTGYMYGRGADDQQEEDIPVLRDPTYDLPKPVPDSPPTRRPPDVRPKPATNAIKYELSIIQSQFSILTHLWMSVFCVAMRMFNFFFNLLECSQVSLHMLTRWMRNVSL